MPTIHYTKKQFIKEMSNFIQDDEHIIVSTDVEGSVELKKKRGIKQIPFAFAVDAFEKQDSIGDLLISKLFSAVIAPNSVVAEKFKTKK